MISDLCLQSSKWSFVIFAKHTLKTLARYKTNSKLKQIRNRAATKEGEATEYNIV
jgi:hypothetical protein